MIVGLFAYFMNLMVNTLEQATYRVNTFIQKTDLTIDTSEQLVLDINNFDIAIQLQYIGADPDVLANIDEFFSYRISQINYAVITDPAEIEAAGNTYWWNNTDLVLSPCREGRFLNMNASTAAIGITNSYLCPPDNFTLTLQGSYSAPVAQVLEIKVDYCD